MLTCRHTRNVVAHIIVGRYRHTISKLAVTGDAAKPVAAARFAVGVMPQQA